MPSAAPYPCANTGQGNAGPCKQPGTMECAACRLVTYCGKKCQVAHWPEHKKDCQSDLMKETWQPAWEREGREPAFLGPTLPGMLGQVKFGSLARSKYLWGNMPAFDLVQLKTNEGADYDKPLSLLFAASGDMRNVVKTVSSLPERFSNRVIVDINDQDIDIVARNAIFLLVFHTSPHDKHAVDCVLHLWYSALIPQDCNDRLAEPRHLIEEVCSKIQSKAADTILGKTWKFPGKKSSLRLVLKKQA